MKLRNLFLASLAICTMASCSKDEDGPSIPQEVDAYLSIAAASELNTKATEVGKDKENVVNTLTAYVFTNDDAATYVIHKTVNATDAGAITTGEGELKSLTAITGIHVKVAAPVGSATTSATSFKVVLLANTSLGAVSNLATLETKTTDDITRFETIGKFYLPMHSDVLTISGITPYTDTEHIQNWYKDASSCATQTSADASTTAAPSAAQTIKLFRSIARVQIESLAANFSGQYTGATFEIDSIFLANVRANATVMGKENTTAAFYRGAPTTFEVIQHLVEPTSDAVKSVYLKEYATALSVSNSTPVTTGIDFSKYINANEIGLAAGFNYQTRVILAGKIKIGDVSKYKYFHIPLADGGKNVESNKIYKITATITGEGNDKVDEILDNACINFKIVVEPWTVVNQEEDDVN